MVKQLIYSSNSIPAVDLLDSLHSHPFQTLVSSEFLEILFLNLLETNQTSGSAAVDSVDSSAPELKMMELQMMFGPTFLRGRVRLWVKQGFEPVSKQSPWQPSFGCWRNGFDGSAGQVK